MKTRIPCNVLVTKTVKSGVKYGKKTRLYPCFIERKVEFFPSKLYKVIRKHGAVAHLARAIEWHSIGSRFDPDQLHLHKSLQ